MAYIVNLLKSNKDRHYIGYTGNLKKRLCQHNCKHWGNTYGIKEDWEIIISKEINTNIIIFYFP
jgi:predicted GIY-YIG superfamily endonuclease